MSKPPYTQNLQTKNPGCIIFMVDQSGSMAAADPKTQHSLAFTAKRATDLTISEIVAACIKQGVVMPRVWIGAYGYSTQYPNNVKWIIKGKQYDTADHAGLISIVDLEETDNEYYDDNNELFINDYAEEAANGGTPMGSAFDEVLSLVENFAQNHSSAHPPIVINISDGEPTDMSLADMEAKAQALRGITTTDGDALLWNIHVSAADPNPIVCPDAGTKMPDAYADAMLASASAMPDAHKTNAAARGIQVGETAKCCVYNADANTLVQMLSFASSVVDL
tara:strand:- start:942 stop:1778 length:837 start_codon:yes stop_codon:yes gene_type:complete